MTRRRPWLAATALAGLCCLAGCSSTVASDAPWTLVSAAPTSPTAVVAYFHGQCDRLTGASVRRTSASVDVTVLSSRGPADAATRC